MNSYRKKIFVIIIFSTIISIQSQTSRRDYLSRENNIDRLNEIVVSLNDWHPYPTINERTKWESIPENLRKTIIDDSEKFLKFEWKTIPASIALDFKRNGNRSRYETNSFTKRNVLKSLLYAELVENKGRFLDDITNGIWSICEESFWGVSAHLGAQSAGNGLPDVTEPTVDLFAAETSALLSWTYYLLDSKLDDVSPLIRKRIKYEIQRRIFTPYLNIDSGWMGFKSRPNNWNPWINSNLLISTLFLQDNDDDRAKLINRILITLDNFINPYPDDGGCDEGPSYWNAAGGRLFTCLDFLYRCTNGKINIYDNSLIKNIATYFYKMHISGRYFFNTGDGAAILNPDPMLIFSIGKKINDDRMTSFGSYLFKKEEKNESDFFNSPVHLGLETIFNYDEIKNHQASEPLIRDFWMPQSQYMGARSSENSSKGFYLGVQGGNNAESHNHNDVGNFIIFSDGNPVIIDIGVETYTAKTFSSKRYEIWTMQSAYHNLPSINGFMQKDGIKYKANELNYLSNENFAQLSMDISKAYPDESKVKSWKRTIKLIRGGNVELTENYDLKELTEPIKLNFITCLEPEINKEGTIYLKSNFRYPNTNIKIHYDKNKFSVQSEKIKIDDNKLKNVWGDSITRMVFTTLDKKLKDETKIIFLQDRQ